MAGLFLPFIDLPSLALKALAEAPEAGLVPQPPAPASIAALQPLRNWSHPFKDDHSPLLQLTQLAKATAGYYPLGRNGLWHGGVHFDSGTASALDQTGVHCLADGEIVAYRIDQHSPSTLYFIDELCVPKPFSRNFVLVRHRLEAPRVEGSTDAPPGLVFYSLYMHLQDWAIYQRDPEIPRPGFWPEGSLRGYVSSDYLTPIAGDEYRVSAHLLNVRAEASANAEVLAQLPRGSEVLVSGEGRFLKLEQVNQSVHFTALEGPPAPKADHIVVLEQPVAIKAGDLIGHLGAYQNSDAAHPEKKLHLEVFSGDDVPGFIEASRAWVTQLPVTGNTWLKLARGTAVVAHQAHFNTTYPPATSATDSLSDADLLVPKNLIDGLPAARKIRITATAEENACNWYRLDGLLHDANSGLLDGWVREEIGVTPWLSPWSWEGYDLIYNDDPPRQSLAAFLRAIGQLSEDQLTRHGALADLSDKGPMKSRLYDIIDRNHDGKMTAEELQAAIGLPAHAQSLSQLIIHYESEWRHTPNKWDVLDEVLGHSGSTPHLNWLAEKERIRQLSWWNEVALGVGLPVDGRVYHLHPVGLGGRFAKSGDLIDVTEFLKLYEKKHTLFASGTRPLSPDSMENLRKIITAINLYYEENLNKANIYEVSYMLATARHEAYYFPTGEHFSEMPEVGSFSYFDKYDPVLASTAQNRDRARQNGNTEKGDGYKYRGRGCVHLTWKNNYRKFSELMSFDFVSNPDFAAKFEHSVPIMIIGMTEGLFTGKKLADYFNLNKVDYLTARKIINGDDQKVLIASYAEKFEAILKLTSKLTSEF